MTFLKIILLAGGLLVADVHAEVCQASAAATAGVAKVNDIDMSYAIEGSGENTPVLLLPGIGMQRIDWPRELVDGFVDRGHRVVMLDLRDSGESTHFADAGAPDFVKLFAAMAEGREPPLPYTAGQMAADVIALLECLQMDRVAIVGFSGGATIGALVALERPELVATLTLIAANSGTPGVAIPAKPDLFARLPQPAPGESHEAMLERRMAYARAFAAPDAPWDEPRARREMERSLSRDRDADAPQRQGAALLALGDLRGRLSAIRSPTLVLHGAHDPLLPRQLGQDVAKVVPGARFVVMDGMGHDLPAVLMDKIVTMTAELQQAGTRK
ncbi:MAG: alpha/beta hydrolase [Pseudoxanthomonas sp.]